MSWRRAVHPTWVVTVGGVGVLLGLGVGVEAHATSIGWLLLGVVMVAGALARPSRMMIVMALAAGFLIGAWRTGSDLEARSVWQHALGDTVTLSGVVAEDVDIGKNGQMTIRLKDVTAAERELPGQLWLTVEAGRDIWRSDRLTVRGRLSDGFGSFSASMYRAEIIKAERPEPGDVALRVRDDFGRHVRAVVDEPAASLGLGFLTGQRKSLPPELDEALRLAGLTHIVVASGYNLTILVRLARRVLAKRSRFLAVFASGLMIVGFMMVTGLSPSMSRAGLVAGLALTFWYFGRQFHPLTLLVLAACITGLINPSYVWGNLGWQLSFAAFFGVMVLAPLLKAYFFGTTQLRFFGQILLETTSAQIMTAPLLLHAFGSISNVAIVANLLVLPLVPLAMALTFASGVLGYVSGLLSSLVAVPTEWLLGYMISVTKFTAGLESAQTEFALSLFGVALAFIFIGLACWYMRRATGYSLRSSSIID